MKRNKKSVLGYFINNLFTQKTLKPTEIIVEEIISIIEGEETILDAIDAFSLTKESMRKAEIFEKIKNEALKGRRTLLLQWEELDDFLEEYLRSLGYSVEYFAIDHEDINFSNKYQICWGE